MSRKQLNIRIPDRNIEQIKELVAGGKFESQSHVVMVAVEKLYDEEKLDGKESEDLRNT